MNIQFFNVNGTSPVQLDPSPCSQPGRSRRTLVQRVKTIKFVVKSDFPGPRATQVEAVKRAVMELRIFRKRIHYPSGAVRLKLQTLK